MQSTVHDIHYCVNFEEEFPKCECKSFARTEVPCKHMFAVLRYSEAVWTDIPENYRNHPYFNPDTHAFSVTNTAELNFQLKTICDSVKAAVNASMSADRFSSSSSEDEEDISENTTPAVIPTDKFLQSTAWECVDQLTKLISSACREVTDVNIMKDSIQQLKDIYNNIQTNCSQGDELLKRKETKFQRILEMSSAFKGKKFIELNKRRGPKRNQAKGDPEAMAAAFDLIVEEQEEVLRNQAALEYWGLEPAERAKFDLDKYKTSLREQVIRPSTSAAACKLLVKFLIYKKYVCCLSIIPIINYVLICYLADLGMHVQGHFLKIN